MREAMRAATGAHEVGAAEARARLAAALDVAPEALQLTAGGSAANNLALASASSHVISQPSEHPSVIEALDALAARGVEVELLPLDARGAVDPADLRRVLRPETSLVSVQHANNETGCLQPVRELAQLLASHPAALHVDAVQTAPWFDVRPATLGADRVTLSIHKLGGPRGVGVLLGAPSSSAPPLELGPDVLAGVLAALTTRAPERADAVRASRDRLEALICAALPDVQVHAQGGPRLPGVLSVSAAGVSGDALVLELERSGIAVATGAACASGDPAPSHVLRAIGVSPAMARASVRFSLGTPLPEAELQRICAAFARAVERMRNLG